MVGAPRFELGTSCAQGRRATRLRYAPTVTALFILKHFPTLLLIRVVILGHQAFDAGRNARGAAPSRAAKIRDNLKFVQLELTGSELALASKNSGELLEEGERETATLF